MRKAICRIGKKFYELIPYSFRDLLLYWAYQVLPFLFEGMPDYEIWLDYKRHEEANNYTPKNIIDIRGIKQASKVNGRIAIHLHMFYPDIIPEFVSYIRKMPFSYDLYVSVCDKNAFDISKCLFVGLPFCNCVDIRQVANRGRDIGPFVCTFGSQLVNYDYIAHLHGKKSVHNGGISETWRRYLCNALFGSEERIRQIFTLMQGEKPFGIVYPQFFARLGYMVNTWFGNRELAQAWCPRIGVSEIPNGYFDMAAGSMFWARGEALAPLFNVGISLDDFAEEAGQTDGTLAHCIERLFVLISLKQGMPPGIIRDAENPSWSAWRLDQYVNRSYAAILRQIKRSGNRVIGFDIFDTLLSRPLLNPETTRRIVARRIGGQVGRAYAEYRAIAERAARDDKGLDIGLDEIYARLEEITGLERDQCAHLREIEEHVEQACLGPREDALRLYRDILASGEKGALIADTVLPRSMIETILRRQGIDGWDSLFVSNEVGLRKDRGDLYEHVLSHYLLKPSQFMMIGDDETSDVHVPAKLGATFIHVLRPAELARGLPRFSDLIVRHERRDEIDSELTLGLVVRKNFDRLTYPDFDPASLVSVTPYNWGYSLVGPLLVSFAQWLLQSVRSDGINRLYFRSREGRLIKRVYDYWVESQEDTPRSEYLAVTKRAAGVAAIETMDDILTLAGAHCFSNDLECFLQARFGLQLRDDQWMAIGQSLGWRRDSEVQVEDRKVEHLAPLLQALREGIFSRALKERTGLQSYLSERDLNLDDHHQAVVDIGCGGSVQGYLNQLLSRKVHGYYLMTDVRSERVAEKHKVFLRGCFHERVSTMADAPALYRGRFDVARLLSSGEAHVQCCDTDAAGELKVRCRELLGAEMDCAELRNSLQQGAMDYAKDARAIRETLLPDFRPSCWTARLLVEAFLSDMSPAERNLLSQIAPDDPCCGRRRTEIFTMDHSMSADKDVSYV